MMDDSSQNQKNEIGNKENYNDSITNRKLHQQEPLLSKPFVAYRDNNDGNNGENEAIGSSNQGSLKKALMELVEEAMDSLSIVDDDDEEEEENDDDDWSTSSLTTAFGHDMQDLAAGSCSSFYGDSSQSGGSSDHEDEDDDDHHDQIMDFENEEDSSSMFATMLLPGEVIIDDVNQEQSDLDDEIDDDSYETFSKIFERKPQEVSFSEADDFLKLFSPLKQRMDEGIDEQQVSESPSQQQEQASDGGNVISPFTADLLKLRERRQKIRKWIDFRHNNDVNPETFDTFLDRFESEIDQQREEGAPELISLDRKPPSPTGIETKNDWNRFAENTSIKKQQQRKQEEPSLDCSDSDSSLKGHYLDYSADSNSSVEQQSQQIHSFKDFVHPVPAPYLDPYFYGVENDSNAEKKKKNSKKTKKVVIRREKATNNHGNKADQKKNSVGSMHETQSQAEQRVVRERVLLSRLRQSLLASLWNKDEN